MFQNEIPYDEKGSEDLTGKEEDPTFEPGKEGKSLPEDIAEYIQKARDDLKTYEECKKYYEKHRKREIILELVDLLVKYDYPWEWFRSIIARELGDYISTSYIEKVLKERYPDERKKVNEQSTSQIEEFPQNDDKIPLELSTTGESIVDDVGDELRKPNPYNTDHTSTEVSAQSRTELERQAEEGTRQIVKTLQRQNKDLKTRCYQLNQLAQEGSMWKEKYTQLQQEFDPYRNKIIKGNTQIEFGSELIPVKIEYNFKTNQFSAKIPQEVSVRIIGALRRR